MACLRDHQLQTFAEKLAKKEPTDPRHRDHLRGCVRCQTELRRYTITDPVTHQVPPGSNEPETLFVPAFAPTPPLEDIDRGVAVGRYVVLNKLSQGAMGVVFCAYDPELDRRVALKLLRNDVQGVDETLRRGRFFREAQALARVNHPNVITIFDIGSYGPYAFLAMNLVEGDTLATWLKAKPRSVDDVVRVFQQAGRGLAAAHAAGLVHGDFKPDNVLVDRADEVFVTDFGLARAADEERVSALGPTTREGLPAYTPSKPWLSADVSQNQDLVGTPRYMAPEQLEGKAADARSDQFSFCASLFEALFGEVPFPGATVPEIRARFKEGTLRSPAARKNVPVQTWKAMVRGLSIDPAQRFESIETLLTALRTRKASSRSMLYRRAAILALGALSLGTWAGVYARSRTTQGCQNSFSRFASSWDEKLRNQVRMALTASPAEYAGETADKVDETLSTYAWVWADTFTQACLRTYVQKQQTPAHFDLQTDCLEMRRREFSALVSLLASGQVDIANAARATQELTAPTVCADAAALERTVKVPTDAGQVALLVELNGQLTHVKALHDAGRFDEALKAGLALLPKVRASHHPPLLAEATYWVGKLHGQVGDLVAAEPLLLESALTAQATRADRIAVLSLSQLGRDTGAGRGLYEEAARYHQQARALLSRMVDDGELTARLLHDWATTLSAQDRGPEAIELYRQALELRFALHGDAHLETLQTLDALADNLMEIAHIDESLTFQNRAQEARLKLFGKSHPLQTAAYYRFAIAHADAGREEEAEKWFQKAFQQIQSLNQKDVSSATAFTNYAEFLIRKKEYPRARAAAEKALAIKRALWSKEHPRTAINLTQLGDIDEAEGHYDKALAMHTQALELKRKAYPKDIRRQARELAAIGADNLGLKRTELAINYFEQALAVLPDNLVNADTRADVTLQLADIFWSNPKQQLRARTLVEQAAKGVAPMQYSLWRSKVDSWLKAHPAPASAH